MFKVSQIEIVKILFFIDGQTLFCKYYKMRKYKKMNVLDVKTDGKFTKYCSCYSNSNKVKKN